MSIQKMSLQKNGQYRNRNREYLPTYRDILNNREKAERGDVYVYTYISLPIKCVYIVLILCYQYSLFVFFYFLTDLDAAAIPLNNFSTSFAKSAHGNSR